MNSNDLPPDSVSITNTLSSLQQQYSDILHQMHQLKQTNHSLKQQISTLLYEKDAAIRIISKLQSQSSKSSDLNPAQSDKSAPDVADKPKEIVVDFCLDEDYISSINETVGKLSSERKTLMKSKNTKVDNVEFALSTTLSTSPIHCIEAYHKGILFFSVDNAIECSNDNWSFKAEPTFTQFKRLHNGKRFILSNPNTFAFFEAEDVDDIHSLEMKRKSVQLFNDITSIDNHPSDRFASITTLTETSLFDYNVVKCLTSLRFPYSSAAFHVDGQLLGLSADSTLSIYDVTSNKFPAHLETPDRISSFLFSNNGYHLAVASQSHAYFYDLRKLSLFHTLDLNVNTPKHVAKKKKSEATCVYMDYDQYAQCFMVGSGNKVSVYKNKTFEIMNSFEFDGKLSGLKFINGASEIAVGTDKGLSLYEDQNIADH